MSQPTKDREGDGLGYHVASYKVNDPAKAEKAAVSPKARFKIAATAVANLSKEANEEKRDDSNNGNDGSENWTRVGYGARMAALEAKADRASANQKLFSRAVVNSTSWDVWSPPPGNSLSGKVVPRIITKHKHRRKCSIEVHKVTPLVHVNKELNGDSNQSPQQQQFGMDSYHECVARILVPATKDLSRRYKLNALKNMAEHNVQSSSDTFHGVSQIHFDETDFDHDDESVTSASSSSSGSSKSPLLKDYGGREFEGWKPKYCLPMHGIFVRGHHKKTVTILISFAHFKQERDLIFDTIDDSRAFVKTIEKQQRLETTRQDDRLKVALGGELSLPKHERIDLLFEIVAAYNINVGDFVSSDPYVSVFMGHQEIHRTDYRSKTLNPIWTLKTGSLFLLQTESRRFFIEDGLKFVVKDYDNIGKDEVLGICKVDPKKFYKANGERQEFKLTQPRIRNAGAKNATDDNGDQPCGVLVIRCRRASQYDTKFIADFAKHDNKAKGVASYTAPEADTSAFKTLTTKVKKRNADGKMMYKIRPCADPKRPLHETEWMTNGAIQEAVLQPSYQWTEIGEGNLGKVYLEILGCDGLPNLDNGAFYGNKTDAFVACVFEDVYGRTDVIDDCLSPRWLPWTHRAFILRIEHPSSILNLGIFDYDSGGERLADHDLIGRVSVDLTNLRSSTQYVLSYNVCSSARVSNRKSIGKIIIRVRMEIPDERKLAMAALYPPPPIYVNSKSLKDFSVIKQTCFGKVDEEEYSTETLKSYVDEIYALEHVLFFLEDGLTTLLLWRGNFEFTIPYLEIKANLPIHSMSAFALAIVIVENPTLLPSLCFASIAWLLLATGLWRQNSHNIWYRCHSYSQIFKMLAIGDDLAEPHKIQPFHNYEKSKEEAEVWMKRIEESAKRAELAAKEAQAAEEERLKELAEIGEVDNDLSTKANQSTMNPMKAALYPIQLMLGIVVRFIRIIKNILIWQEAYFSFWITTGSLLLAVVFLFVPWLWCIKWASRVFAWTVFGPWMKLVDKYYYSLLKPETEEQRQLRMQAEKLKAKLTHSETVTNIRIQRENTAKLKAMKEYMFGKYALRIPILKQDRFPDLPLAESFATPYREKDLSLAELAMQEAGYNKIRVPGQTLIGDMIPYIQEEGFTQAPTGKAALHTEKLSKGAPGSKGGVVTNPVKIFFVILVAIAITYFGTSVAAQLLAKSEETIEALVLPGQVSDGDL
eukprot:CAMPEP_0197177648 /NCGR_PEP_ID=MMETSP1423-20130617/3180_1 /TAXON_ID=476441 /ORGANISM="Pseudo-nitzschia heimii, Strain UNC1101" /LENGTH=1215 /DNA_ID=CAMNT_0042627229 /DNA_START=106 /DNA_END=3753 /DNA_ORIENTATION=-